MCRGHQEKHPADIVRRQRSDQGYGQQSQMVLVELPAGMHVSCQCLCMLSPDFAGLHGR